MPATLAPVSYEPIRAVRVLSQQGALPQLLRAPEDATQTFKLGVPVKIVAGYVQECAFSGADIVYGVSAEFAHNYSAAGGGVTFGLPPNVPGSAELNDTGAGGPLNWASGVITPIGAALRDGQMGVYAANGQTVFSIALKATQTFVQTLIIPGTLYGLTKDSGTGFWYLDTADTTGNNAVANLIGYDGSSPNTSAGGCRVFFTFAAALRAF